ncbi:type II secretion system protein GspM [Haliangium sp.]|uniref:type II secretion system protein GspM n=1 Tax=Haliangium sp. TaxID=2663208 RepID=UPI003D13DF30
MDKLRDRWEQFSPREQRLLLLLSVAFVATVFVLLGRGISGGLDALTQKNQDTRQVLAALADYRDSRSEKDADAPVVALPDEPIKLQSYLEGIANDVGVSIPGFNPQAGVSKEGVVTASMRFDIRGLSLAELTTFLEQVETRAESVVVESLEIRRHFRDKDKLDASMLVTAYANPQKKEEASEGAGDGEAEGEEEDG